MARTPRKTTQKPQNTPENTVTDTPETPTPKKRVAPAEVAFQATLVDGITFTPQASKRNRSEYQQSVDALVKDGYGKPFVAVEIDATEKAIKDFTQRIRYASEHLKVGVRLGELHPGSTPEKVVFTFRVTDRISRARKPKPSAE